MARKLPKLNGLKRLNLPMILVIYRIHYILTVYTKEFKYITLISFCNDVGLGILK